MVGRHGGDARMIFSAHGVTVHIMPRDEGEPGAFVMLQTAANDPAPFVYLDAEDIGGPVELIEVNP